MRNRRLLTLIAAALALLVLPAAAQARDRNHDRIPDKWEKRFHISTRVNSANADPDRDHVDNRNEFREGTNPRRRDSNHNGIPDGREDRDHDNLNNAGEDATGNDPRNPDTDHDGIRDGAEQSGVVASVTGDLVTIDLRNGGSVSARVDADTDLTCESEAQAEKAQGRHRRGRAHSASDEPPNPPTGDNPPGGDDPGAGDTPGDEPGADDDPADDPNADDGGDQGDEPATGGASDSCPAGALKVGARVHEAALDIGPDGAVWSAIALLRG